MNKNTFHIIEQIKKQNANLFPKNTLNVINGIMKDKGYKKWFIKLQILLLLIVVELGY